MGIIGTAVGMAAMGLRPVVEIQFSAFSMVGYHHLRLQAAYLLSRTRGALSCPMVLRTPYGGGIHALDLHSESEESIYVTTPGLKVVVPSNPANAKGLLQAAIRDPDPVVFLEPIRMYRAVKEEVADSRFTVPIGTARIVRSGDDVTLVAYGAMVREAVAAADALAEADVAAEVIDLRSLIPWDVETVVESVRAAGLDPGLLHAANSAAIVNHPSSHLDMVRPGILAYGAVPSAGLRPPANLKPVMRFASRLVHIHELAPGHSISYGGEFVTPERMRVGTAPIGYGHGFPFQDGFAGCELAPYLGCYVGQAGGHLGQIAGVDANLVVLAMYLHARPI